MSEENLELIETSMFAKGPAMRELVGVWRKADKKFNEERNKSNSLNINHSVGAIFYELFAYMIKNDRDFNELFCDLSTNELQRCWKVFEEYYESKYTYDPKVFNEIRIKLSHIK